MGLGLSADELAANPRLTERTMHDLNADSRLPYTDASFDAALITVSIQHLTRPVDVLREVARPLRPDGVLPVLFFSNWYFTVYLGGNPFGLGDRHQGVLHGLDGLRME